MRAAYGTEARAPRTPVKKRALPHWDLRARGMERCARDGKWTRGRNEAGLASKRGNGRAPTTRRVQGGASSILRASH